MVEGKAAEAVRFLEQCLKSAGLRDLRVIPFGSHALGGATAESDVDLAIISPSFCGKDIFERARLTKDAELRAMRRYMLPFDIVTLTPEEFESDSLLAAFIKAASTPSA